MRGTTVKKRGSPRGANTRKSRQRGGSFIANSPRFSSFKVNSSSKTKRLNSLLSSPILSKFLSELQLSKRPAAVRVAFYKYIDTVFHELLTPKEVKSALSLFIPRVFTNAPGKFEGQNYNIIEICKELQSILKLIKELPKGVSHHDHHYSIVYTERFLTKLLEEGLLEEKGLVLVFIPKYEMIEPETREFIEGIIPENTLCVFPKGAPQKGLFHVKNDPTLSTRVQIEEFSNSEIYYTLKQVQMENEIPLIHLGEILSLLQVNETNVAWVNTPKKAWAFLEYAAERYKWVVNHSDIINESWKYAASVAQEENIQELQVKYTFNLWNWTNDYHVQSYDKDTRCLTKDEVSVCSTDSLRKRHFMELSQLFKRIKDETGVSIHLIVGAARPFDLTSLTSVLCKFNLYNSFNQCLTEPLIIGYDMYGQEDVTRVKGEKHTSLLNTLARKVTPRSQSYDPNEITYSILLEKLKDFKETAPNKDDISFTLHAGESYNTDRNSAGIQNLELAERLNALRIGHGIILKSSERLMKVYKEKKILVELCPLSNSFLGFVPDAKKHPAEVLIKKDLLVSINTDNRGILNYDYVSYDWFDLVLFSDLSTQKSRGIKDVYTILLKIAWDSINSASSIPQVNDELRMRWISAYKKFYGEEIENPSRLANSTAQSSSLPFVTAVGR